MGDAFTLVAQPGRAASVLEGLRSLEGVIDVEMVTGACDMIARIAYPTFTIWTCSLDS